MTEQQIAERKRLAAEIEDVAKEHVHMPKVPLDLPANRYLNTTPAALSPEALKGKIVLMDIWDYTCVNCIRTLPYIKEWNRRYADKGLVIIGIHAPEFEFEKTPGNLDSAVRSFGLTYPVIADNDFKLWNELANQYWPAKYIFDGTGTLRAEHFGEGEYQAFEAFIQKLLLERDSTLELPELFAPVRETDKPGAVCYRPTPETYVGFARSHLGNEDEGAINKAKRYQLPDSLEHDRLYLEGTWICRREYAQPSGADTAQLVIDYQAKEVNLVIHPLEGVVTRVEVRQDGHPVAKADRGEDLREDATGATYLEVTTPRMYRITNNGDFGRHSLVLASNSPHFGAYAFTFTTACKKD